MSRQQQDTITFPIQYESKKAIKRKKAKQTTGQETVAVLIQAPFYAVSHSCTFILCQIIPKDNRSRQLSTFRHGLFMASFSSILKLICCPQYFHMSAKSLIIFLRINQKTKLMTTVQGGWYHYWLYIFGWMSSGTDWSGGTFPSYPPPFLLSLPQQRERNLRVWRTKKPFNHQREKATRAFGRRTKQ